MIAMSGTGGPLIEKLNDGLSPLIEKTHRSAVPVREVGR